MRFPFFWTSPPEHRPVAKWQPGRRRGGPDALEVFEFDARQVVLAIAFHLVDEGIASAVCRGSCEATVTHLTHECAGGTVLTAVASHWRQMTHRERMEWLMESSHTGFELSEDGVARLVPR